jgi:phage-related protein
MEQRILTAVKRRYISIDMIKPLKFVGSSKQDLSAFPVSVKQDVGHSLFVAQEGGRAPTVKTLQGFGGGSVVEIVDDHDGDTYRCVYTTKVSDVIVVLYAFQKKSKRASQTPKHDVDLIHTRLRGALNREWN